MKTFDTYLSENNGDATTHGVLLASGDYTFVNNEIEVVNDIPYVRILIPKLEKYFTRINKPHILPDYMVNLIDGHVYFDSKPNDIYHCVFTVGVKEINDKWTLYQNDNIGQLEQSNDFSDIFKGDIHVR